MSYYTHLQFQDIPSEFVNVCNFKYILEITEYSANLTVQDMLCPAMAANNDSLSGSISRVYCVDAITV